MLSSARASHFGSSRHVKTGKSGRSQVENKKEERGRKFEYYLVILSVYNPSRSGILGTFRIPKS